MSLPALLGSGPAVAALRQALATLSATAEPLPDDDDARLVAAAILQHADAALGHLEALPAIAAHPATELTAVARGATSLVGRYAQLAGTGVLDETAPGGELTTRQVIGASLLHLAGVAKERADQLARVRAAEARIAAARLVSEHDVEWTPKPAAPVEPEPVRTDIPAALVALAAFVLVLLVVLLGRVLGGHDEPAHAAATLSTTWSIS